MTAFESIGNARTRIAQARELLVRPSPGSLETCRELLGEVAQILQEVIAQGAIALTPEVIRSAQEIQWAAQELQSQIEHGSRFCLGWMQMRMSLGYSDTGVPILVETEGRSYEL
jgi:hypothetical protein